MGTIVIIALSAMLVAVTVKYYLDVRRLQSDIKGYQRMSRGRVLTDTCREARYTVSLPPDGRAEVLRLVRGSTEDGTIYSGVSTVKVFQDVDAAYNRMLAEELCDHLNE